MPAITPGVTPGKTGKRLIRMKRMQEKLDDTNRQNIWRWCRLGYLPAPIYLGRLPFWDEDEVDRAIEQRKAG